MSYTKNVWRDFETGGTPITAEKLNHIEDGIEDLDQFRDSISPEIRHIETGYEKITSVAGKNTSKKISFSTDFEHAPMVFVTPHSNSPSAVSMTANGITTKGFSAWIYRESSIETSFMWLAVE